MSLPSEAMLLATRDSSGLRSGRIVGRQAASRVFPAPGDIYHHQMMLVYEHFG